MLFVFLGVAQLRDFIVTSTLLPKWQNPCSHAKNVQKIQCKKWKNLSSSEKIPENLENKIKMANHQFHATTILLQLNNISYI